MSRKVFDYKVNNLIIFLLSFFGFAYHKQLPFPPNISKMRDCNTKHQNPEWQSSIKGLMYLKLSQCVFNYNLLASDKLAFSWNMNGYIHDESNTPEVST